MSEELQSILLEDLKIAMPGIVLRRIALNRHMPRVEKLSEHVHDFLQILLYLSGTGEQHFDGSVVPVSRGTILAIPPEKSHRFVKAKAARPICLAIDLEIEALEDWPDRGFLNRNQLATIESHLFELNKLQREREPSSISIASRILRILEEMEGALRNEIAIESAGPVYARLMRAIQNHGLRDSSPNDLAIELGKSLDHLNRQLRAEVGLTVGQALNRTRLERCSNLLQKTNVSIGEIGSAIGFDDQNYFARWFRKQTGQSPSHWRNANN